MNHNDAENPDTPILMTYVPFYLDRVSGYQPAYATVLRWANTGRGGVKLGSRVIGGRMSTTRAELAAFFSAPIHGSMTGLFSRVARCVERRKFDGTGVERAASGPPERSK